MRLNSKAYIDLKALCFAAEYALARSKQVNTPSVAMRSDALNICSGVEFCAAAKLSSDRLGAKSVLSPKVPRTWVWKYVVKVVPFSG